ncbi:MAG: zinc-ribbon domain-containing protein [Chloroflexi bacterium]|nr:zinc-ribbon domain-containing protein [Chloroflexota bacterium]
MITFAAILLVLVSIGVVSLPLLRGVGRRGGLKLVVDSEVSEVLAKKDATLLAISELESDYEIGSLSQSDYQELRKKYEEKAVALIKTADELQSARNFEAADHIDEEIEARVSARRGARGAIQQDQDIESRVSQIRNKRGKDIGAEGKYCPSCGSHIQTDDAFCSRCGAALSLKCPGCAAAIGPDDRFCAKCGTSLNPEGEK